jgi:hypothetical protein
VCVWCVWCVCGVCVVCVCVCVCGVCVCVCGVWVCVGVWGLGGARPYLAHHVGGGLPAPGADVLVEGDVEVSG